MKFSFTKKNILIISIVIIVIVLAITLPLVLTKSSSGGSGSASSSASSSDSGSISISTIANTLPNTLPISLSEIATNTTFGHSYYYPNINIKSTINYVTNPTTGQKQASTITFNWDSINGTVIGDDITYSISESSYGILIENLKATQYTTDSKSFPITNNKNYTFKISAFSIQNKKGVETTKRVQT